MRQLFLSTFLLFVIILKAQGKYEIKTLFASKTIFRSVTENKDLSTNPDSIKEATALVNVSFNVKNLESNFRLLLQIGSEAFESKVMSKNFTIAPDPNDDSRKVLLNVQKNVEAKIIAGGVTLNYQLQGSDIAKAKFVSIVLSDNKGNVLTKSYYPIKN